MKTLLRVLILAIPFFSSVSVHAQAAKKPLATLIIDPGHGGLDPGAKGMLESEANVALQVSLKFGDTLSKLFPDMKIIYTRTTDVLPGNLPNKDAALRYRANLANENNGNLFIAIHCNSAGKRPGGWYERRVVGKTPVVKTVKKGKKTYKKTTYVYQYANEWVENRAKGTETYIWAVGKNDDKISTMNKVNDDYTGEIDSTSTLTLPDANDPTEQARMLIYAQNYFRKSLSLADMVQTEFTNQGRVNRGVKQRNDKGIWVLQATAMPSILIEIGFISNKEEEEYLVSPEGQAEIVKNITAAFIRYKDKVEKKGTVTQEEPEKKAF